MAPFSAMMPATAPPANKTVGAHRKNRLTGAPPGLCPAQSDRLWRSRWTGAPFNGAVRGRENGHVSNPSLRVVQAELYARAMMGGSYPSRIPMPLPTSSDPYGALACVGWKSGMTIFFPHRQKFRGRAGGSRSTTASSSLGVLARRAGKRIRFALRIMHRAIVTAKTRRLQRELMLHEIPQQPLILGDKWDF
jgi:hypothetical protein